MNKSVDPATIDAHQSQIDRIMAQIFNPGPGGHPRSTNEQVHARNKWLSERKSTLNGLAAMHPNMVNGEVKQLETLIIKANKIHVQPGNTVEIRQMLSDILKLVHSVQVKTINISGRRLKKPGAWREEAADAARKNALDAAYTNARRPSWR